MKRSLIISSLLMLLISTGQAFGFGKEPIPARVKWMQDGLYGIMYPLTAAKAGVTNVEQWNELVDQFDVVAFAQQAEAAGAAWVIFPLGGDAGYWCAPSETMDKIISDRPSRCSTRDLPMELENALHRKGIKLILSMPARAPQNDPHGMKALGDTDAFLPAPDIFKVYWETAIREWSTRYGTRLAGWWFSQVHNWDAWEDEALPQNFTTWADAARAGHPDRVLTFNSKKVAHAARQKKRMPEPLDFAPGEIIAGFATLPPEHDREIPPGALGHKRIPLAGQWGALGYPVRTPGYLATWIKALEQAKRALTIDVGVWQFEGHYGLLPPWQLDCLDQVRKQVREDAPPAVVSHDLVDLGTNATYFASTLSRLSPERAGPYLLTTGAPWSGDAFVSERQANPYIVVSVDRPAILRRLDIYRSPVSDWEPTALAVWLWKFPAKRMTAAAAAVDSNWARMWSAEKSGWQWILSMNDGVELQHIKIGLEQEDAEFRLGKVKLYGTLLTDPNGEALPEDWQARQRALEERNKAKPEKRKKIFGIF